MSSLCSGFSHCLPLACRKAPPSECGTLSCWRARRSYSGQPWLYGNDCKGKQRRAQEVFINILSRISAYQSVLLQRKFYVCLCFQSYLGRTKCGWVLYNDGRSHTGNARRKHNQPWWVNQGKTHLLLQYGISYRKSIVISWLISVWLQCPFKKVYSLGAVPLQQITELREKYTYNITPFTAAMATGRRPNIRGGMQVILSDEDDIDDDELMDNITCFTGIFPPGMPGSPSKTRALGGLWPQLINKHILIVLG